MATPAQGRAGQVVCPLDRTKRFFLYVVEGEIEACCTECGARLYDILRGQEIPASP